MHTRPTAVDDKRAFKFSYKQLLKYVICNVSFHSARAYDESWVHLGLTYLQLSRKRLLDLEWIRSA